MIEVLHGTRETPVYDKNIAVRLYNNDEAEDYPNHWQPSFELIMPVVNKYTIYIENQEIVLNPYDIFLISPGILHRIKAPSTGRRYIMLFDSTYFSSVTGMEGLSSMFGPFTYFTADTVSCLPELDQYIENIHTEFMGDNPLKYASIYANLLQFLILAKRNAVTSIVDSSIKSANSSKYVETFLKICEYIEQNCNSDITVTTLADMSGFSESHFIRLFKQFTNTTYYNYLNICRINMAKRLIATSPELSITEVSMQSGFTSISTFNRLFKHYVDCSPTQYRNLQSIS